MVPAVSVCPERYARLDRPSTLTPQASSSEISWQQQEFPWFLSPANGFDYLREASLVFFRKFPIRPSREDPQRKRLTRAPRVPGHLARAASGSRVSLGRDTSGTHPARDTRGAECFSHAMGKLNQPPPAPLLSPRMHLCNLQPQGWGRDGPKGAENNH